jgi:nicotinamidase-related amidase
LYSNKLLRKESALIVVDVQDKLLSVIDDWRSVLAHTMKMIQYAQVLDVPVIVTEQYPRGLGPTHDAIKELIPGLNAMEKTVFSCFGAVEFEEQLRCLSVKSLVVTGIETHICVNQTTLDGLARGYSVHIIADAVGSRSAFNKEIGLAKMRQAGAIISSSETALYEWLERSDSAEFKAVLPLVK